MSIQLGPVRGIVKVILLSLSYCRRFPEDILTVSGSQSSDQSYPGLAPTLPPHPVGPSGLQHRAAIPLDRGPTAPGPWTNI